MSKQYREVVLVEQYRDPGKWSGPFKERDKTRGRFHEWGLEFEEFETGPGLYSVAIVEGSDGRVITWPANLVRFIEPLPEPPLGKN